MLLDPKILETLKRKALIESVGASVRLSGSTVTNEEVEQILDEQRRLKKQAKSQIEPSSKSDSDIREQ